MKTMSFDKLLILKKSFYFGKTKEKKNLVTSGAFVHLESVMGHFVIS